MANEKIDLFVTGRFARNPACRQIGQFAEDPGIQHGSPSDRDRSTSGHFAHPQGVLGRADIAIADDRDFLHGCGRRGDAVEIDFALKSLLPGPAMNGDGLNPCRLETLGQIGCRDRIAVPAKSHLDCDWERYGGDDVFDQSTGLARITQQSSSPSLPVDLGHRATHVDIDSPITAILEPAGGSDQLIHLRPENLHT